MKTLSISGSELEPYRNLKKLTQAELGSLLGVSGSTVNRWEKDEQEIPGPAQLLLRMLIHGELPFSKPEAGAEAKEAEHFWQLKLSLADWHKLEGLATAGGFATVRDYLLAMIQEDLNAARQAESGGPGQGLLPARREVRYEAGEELLHGSGGAAAENAATQALAAEEVPNRGGGGGAGDGGVSESSLSAAARAFAAKNPVLPEPTGQQGAAGTAGGAAGSAPAPAGRRGRLVRVRQGTPKGKR